MADNVIRELQTRIALKYDSFENWQKSDLVLLPGEVAICEIAGGIKELKDSEGNVVERIQTAPTVLFKVGGTEKKAFKDLPWASAKAADVYSWAKASAISVDETKKSIVLTGGAENGDDLELPINYITPEEVTDITGPLTTRIAAVEEALGLGATVEGGESIAERLVAAEASLDDILGHEAVGNPEDEGYVAAKVGLIDQALADAKSYTDTREAEIETAYKAYADGIASDTATNIAGLRDELGAETTARTNADAALSGRLDRVEAFFATGKDEDGNDIALDEALDTLVEIQKYITSDGQAAQNMLDAINANATDITALEAEVFGVEANEAEGISAQEGLVHKVATNAANIAGLEEDVTSLQALTGGFAEGETKGAIKTAIEAAQSTANQGVAAAGVAQAAAEAAQSAANTAQNEVDALELVVGTLRGEYDVTAALAGTNAADIAALTARVGSNEEAIVDINEIIISGTDSNANLRSDLTALAGVVGNTDSGLVKGLAEVKDTADAAKELADDHATRIAAIEGDYLKQADYYVFQCGNSTVNFELPASN